MSESEGPHDHQDPNEDVGGVDGSSDASVVRARVLRVKAAEERLLEDLHRLLTSGDMETDASVRLREQLRLAEVSGLRLEDSLLPGLLRRLGLVDARRRIEKWAARRGRIGVLLKEALNRAVLHDVGPDPQVRGKDVVWRSPFGPRRHELSFPTHSWGSLAWDRSKAHARFAIGPRRLTALAVGGSDVVRLLESRIDISLVEAPGWREALHERQPDIFIVDTSFPDHARDLIDECERLGVQLVLCVAGTTTGEVNDWPAHVPCCAATRSAAERWRALERDCLLLTEDLPPDFASTEVQSQAAERRNHSRIRWERRHTSDGAVARRFVAYCGLPSVDEPLPRVSVLCVSNRSERALACLQAFDRQRYPSKEFIYVANTDAPPEQMLSILDARRDVVLLRGRTDLSLGEGLSRARAAASGELWTKMDDDDHYGANYLPDLVDAMLETKAAIVGKATFYTYLDGQRTLYLKAEGPENARTDRFVQGGTILADRRQVEGIDFPPVRRGTDTLFLQQCSLLGLHIHSADRFNYAYIRYASGHHTFDVSTEGYLRNAVYLGDALDADAVDL